MEHTIRYAPAYAMAEIIMQPGESVVVESGSMVGMSDNLNIKTSIGGSKSGFFGWLINLLLAFIRKFLGGESLFLNTYTPEGGPGTLLISPALAGDIIHHKLEGNSLFIQGSSFLASSPGITIKAVWGGFRSLFGGEGLFLLKASGSGDLWVNSYGAIKEIEVNGRYTVDTGHIVAFDDTLNYRVKAVGGLKSTFLSGEGLVTEFSGNGRLYIQTHNLGSLVGWVTPLLPR